ARCTCQGSRRSKQELAVQAASGVADPNVEPLYGLPRRAADREHRRPVSRLPTLRARSGTTGRVLSPGLQRAHAWQSSSDPTSAAQYRAEYYLATSVG